MMPERLQRAIDAYAVQGIRIVTRPGQLDQAPGYMHLGFRGNIAATVDTQAAIRLCGIEMPDEVDVGLGLTPTAWMEDFVYFIVGDKDGRYAREILADFPKDLAAYEARRRWRFETYRFRRGEQTMGQMQHPFVRQALISFVGPKPRLNETIDGITKATGFDPVNASRTAQDLDRVLP